MPAATTAGWALHYLMDHGVVSRAQCLVEGVTALETSVSHTAYRISIGGKPRFFLKRGDPIRSQGRDLGSEAAVYRLAETHPDLARILPGCMHIGPADQLVVLDALAADPLTEFTPAAMEAYGRALAIAHGVRCRDLGQPPWLLTCLESLWGTYDWLTPPSAALMQRLQQEEGLRRAFRQAWAEWRTGTLVHGDLRCANALLDRSETRLWLVDWELACSGDPAWDLGSVMADLLTTSALQAMRADIGAEAMAQLQPTLAGYRAVLPLPEREWAALLQRSVRLAGIRLVQTVLEMGFFSEESMQQGEALLVPWIRHLLHNTQPVAAALLREEGR